MKEWFYNLRVQYRVLWMYNLYRKLWLWENTVGNTPYKRNRINRKIASYRARINNNKLILSMYYGIEQGSYVELSNGFAFKILYDKVVLFPQEARSVA